MAFPVVIIVLTLAGVCSTRLDYRYNPMPSRYTQPQIRIKQGILQGIVVESGGGTRRCEQYLGIPYAAAPVGELRFMPPGSAPPWPNILYADRMGPVCPQRLPSLKNMSSESKEKFRRLAQYLTNSTEDCLFLNIYAPIREDYQRNARKLPVMVYIHGESYEWNSGNAYDGCVLSNYGNVIFITINFRLGILGFLKAGLGDQARSNFGLVDQVAALLWVQENIAAFGGDPNSVTLIGHDTGAACVNFLMMSPMVARGAGNALFHRAILMAGSALADWALAKNSLQLTHQVAQELNCPLSDDGLAACLRRKRLSEIMSVQVMAPTYVTKFGPIVDGLVVPNLPKHLMSTYNELFGRYEMMYGVTEIESDQLLGNVALIHGLLERERNNILREYLQDRFEYQPELALASTLREYTDLSQSSAINCRDTVLEVLSDARMTAPLVQTGNYHSAVNPKSYFYVFGHNTFSKEFLQDRTLHGEELPYVFGAPLGGATDIFPNSYSQEEKLFSEIVMTLWTNFARTGNPNAISSISFLNMRPQDWDEYWPSSWPEYETKNQSYMYLDIPPRIQMKYRQPLMQFWNEILPEVLKNQTKVIPVRTTRPTVATSPSQIFTTNPYGVLPPYFTKYDRITSHEPPPFPTRRTYRRPTSEPIFGSIRKKIIETNAYTPEPGMLGTPTDDVSKDVTPEANIETSNTTMNVLIIVGGLFLLVNVLTFAGLYYKRRRLRTEERNLKRQYEDTNLLTLSDVTPEKKPRINGEPTIEADNRGCNVMEMIRQSTARSDDTYEAVVKQSEDSSNSNQRFKLTRQISSSTIDPHTKVRDWIAHEIVHRCSPRFLRRTRQQFALEHKLTQQREQDKKKPSKTSDSKTLLSTTTTGKNSTRPVSPLTKNSSLTSTPKTGSKITTGTAKTGTTKPGTCSTSSTPKKPSKVSVAIDATPGARGSSVLKQQPIELSKSMDLCKKDSEVKPLRRSATMEDFLTGSPKVEEPCLRRSVTNINLKSQVKSATKPVIDRPKPNIDIIKIHHQHSRSDPVQTTRSFDEPGSYGTLRMRTFDANQDVNVTSRDEYSKGPLSPEESLQTIKRRNFPKVLPDFPGNSPQNNALKRRSLPPQSFLMIASLPENRRLQPHCSNSLKSNSRLPPAPPPRSSSTLDRRPSHGTPICQPSPVQIAEEPPIPEEPTITSNSLHVGPLIPTRQVRRTPDTEHSVQSYTLNTQPIYDNLRAPSEDKPANTKKATPKTIITADPDNPVKKIDQPKVIIKPSISRKLNDPTKINKVIPRVVAKDNSTEYEPEVHRSEEPRSGGSNSKSTKSKLTRIPTFLRSSKSEKSQSSSESSNSTTEGSDTGTVVKRK